MIPLPSTASSRLTWLKVSCRNFELHRNEEVIGTLQRPSFWSMKYEAETHDGRWTFRRVGWLDDRTEIVNSASGQAVAFFKAKWSRRGGTLTFADGETFQLGCKGWLRPVWTVTGGAGEWVVRLLRREKEVELPAAATVPESRLALLILFTWYHVMQTEEEAATAATAAVIAAS